MHDGARTARSYHNLRMAKPIVVLAVGVLVPVLLSSAVGIVALALWQDAKDIVLGVLAVCFAAASIGGAVLLTVLLGRRARLARQQTDLLANVSHELRTPLAAIKMYAQTMQSAVMDQNINDARTCADAIARESEWLSVMIDRLLSWRSMARDRDSLQFVTLPLSEVASRVADRFRSMIPPGAAEVSFTAKTCLPVRHDPDAISSILLNLLTNAYKYSRPPRSIALEVVDSRNSVFLSVRDNGVGIPPGLVRRIFEPFYRIRSTAGGAGGAGLGLAIVDALVKSHRGTISVVSTEGSGSCFTIVLPATSPSPVPPSPRSPTPTTREGPPP